MGIEPTSDRIRGRSPVLKTGQNTSPDSPPLPIIFLRSSLRKRILRRPVRRLGSSPGERPPRRAGFTLTCSVGGDNIGLLSFSGLAMEELPVTVLFVEDDRVTRDMVAFLMRRFVKELWVAENGAQGLELFRCHKPDIVVTDIRMPEKDGLKMSLEIKAMSPTTEIIITTAYSEVEYLLKAIDIGIDRYVLKPVEAKDLYDAVKRSCEIIELYRVIERQRAEQEKLIVELRDALANVKTLQDLLPICASCKKIRDDSGYRQQLETYFLDHSDILFSHCLCPECAEKTMADKDL